MTEEAYNADNNEIVIVDTPVSQSRPSVAGLQPAVYFKDPKWDRLFDVGDSIVIERFSTLLSGNMWLDTQTFQVMAINDETGDVNLYNNQASQWAMTNYATAPLYGHNLLFATGSLEKKTPEEQTAVFDKIKETLPEQAQTQNEQVQVISVPSLPPTQVKRPRGRPKGSKNRPKEVILQEKLAKEKK